MISHLRKAFFLSNKFVLCLVEEGIMIQGKFMNTVKSQIIAAATILFDCLLVRL